MGAVRTPAFRAYLERVGRPMVTEREVVQAKRLCAEGLSYREVGLRLPRRRVPSTVFWMVRK